MVDKLIPRFIKCRKSFSNEEYTVGATLIKFQDTNLPEIEKKYFNQIRIYFKTKLISLENDKFIYSYVVIGNKLQLKLQQVICKPEQIVPIKHILSDLFEFTNSNTQVVDCKDCMCQRHVSDCWNCIWFTIGNGAIVKTDFYNYKKGDIINSEIIVCTSSSLLFIQESIFSVYIDIQQDHKSDTCNALMDCGLYYDVADKIVNCNKPKYIEQNLYANLIENECNWIFNPNEKIWFNNYFKFPILGQLLFDKCDVNLETSRICFKIKDTTYLASIFLHIGEKVI